MSFAALGQIMLYVDGMEGIAVHTDTLQWLYSLLSSQVHILAIDSHVMLRLIEYSYVSSFYYITNLSYTFINQSINQKTFV